MNIDTPIHGSDLLKSVFDRDERLIDILAGHSPQLAKLRYSPVRRVMSRVTTVAQAARLCGIPAESLVKELNDALGLDSAHAATRDVEDASAPEPLAAEATAPPAWTRGHVVELDVREDLRNGKEPFSRIMAAFAKLADDEALHLRATFEPVPLFAVMDKRGFAHRALQHAPDDWSVWFYRTTHANQAAASPASPSSPPVAPVPPQPLPDGLTEVRIDVRGLEPPEPMVRTLEALEVLPAACVLLHVNARVPQLLLPILRERGFDFQIDESHSGEVHVRIWRNSPALVPPAEDRSAGDAHFHVHQTKYKEPAMSQQPVSSSSATVHELDVRPIPPRDKHPSIFGMFDRLTPGEAMLLINDHDPMPLRYQLLAEHPDTFEWTYLEQGPEVWRVRIDRK